MDRNDIKWILDTIAKYVDCGSGTYYLLCEEIIKHFDMKSHFPDYEYSNSPYMSDEESS